MTTRCMYMLFNFSGIEISSGRIGVYLKDYINIATGCVY